MAIERYYKVDIAKKYGIGEAIFIHNLAFWIKKNQANNRHYYRGFFWVYNSYKAFVEQFEEFSKSQIETIIKNLINKKVILKDIISEREDNISNHINYYTICDKEILKLYEIEYNKDNIEKQKQCSEEKEIKNTEKNNNNFDNYTSEKSEGFSEKSEGFSEKSEGFSEKSEGFSEKSEGFSEKSEGFSEKSEATDTITYTRPYIYPDTRPYTSPESVTRARACEPSSAFQKSTYENLNGDYIEFENRIVLNYVNLTGKPIINIRQIPEFKTEQGRAVLKTAFDNRKSDFDKAINNALLSTSKSNREYRWMDFMRALYLNLASVSETTSPPKTEKQAKREKLHEALKNRFGEAWEERYNKAWKPSGAAVDKEFSDAYWELYKAIGL